MLTQSTTLDDLVAGTSEEHCEGCPPERVCAWACKQGLGVTDNAALATLGFSLDLTLDTDTDAVRRALCECYG